MEKLIFPARMENFEAMIDFILKSAGQAGFDKKVMGNLRLACEEALVNVINYAYQDKPGDIEINTDIIREGKGLAIEIIDWGAAFDPLAKAAPDLNVPVAERKIGGLGIYLVRRIMDEVKYRREEDRNILTLIKY